MGFNLSHDSAHVAVEVLLDEQIETLDGQFVIRAPDADAQVGELGIDLDEDLLFAVDVLLEVLGEVGGQGVDAWATETDGWTLLQLLVVEVPDVTADDDFDGHVKQVGVLVEPVLDTLFEHIAQGAISDFGPEMGSDDDQQRVAVIHGLRFRRVLGHIPYGSGWRRPMIRKCVFIAERRVMLQRTGKIIGMLSLLAVVGCHTWAGDQTTEGSDGKADTDKEPPVMVDEASLPKGFPMPSAVGEVTLKTYPAHRLARVTRERVEGSRNRMFMPLFRHIQKNDIAMTSPVEMVYRMPEGADTMDGKQLIQAMEMDSMAFYYGDPDTGEVGADGQLVVVEDVGPVQVASFAIRGEYTRQHMALGIKKILQWLDEQREQGVEIEISGSPRYMGYNSPMVPAFLKIGEVQIPVKVSEPEQESAAEL